MKNTLSRFAYDKFDMNCCELRILVYWIIADERISQEYIGRKKLHIYICWY